MAPTKHCFREAHAVAHGLRAQLSFFHVLCESAEVVFVDLVQGNRGGPALLLAKLFGLPGSAMRGLPRLHRVSDKRGTVRWLIVQGSEPTPCRVAIFAEVDLLACGRVRAIPVFANFVVTGF